MTPLRAKAHDIVKAVDEAFDRDERLRLGKYLLPQEREAKIALMIESALRAVVERCVEIAGEHMTVGKMIADKIRREFLE